jgi:2-dehydro-3-deoxygluconokinase
MVLGDSLPVAARYGASAASLVVGGKGGTGLIPTFEQTSAHAQRASEGELSSLA